MTRRTNARVAGATFLLYIATALYSMALFDRVTGSGDAAAKLAGVVQHATAVRVTAVLGWLTFVYAVVLGVTLWALTRDEDPHLATLAMCCRTTEGMLGAVAAIRTLELIPVATAATARAGAQATGATALGGFLLGQDNATFLIAGSCFALGSTLFAWLFLRARSIPPAIAWLGLVGSLLILIGLPLQTIGLIPGPVARFIWVPVALFEVALAFWLLLKGVAGPRLQTRPQEDTE